MEVINLNFIPSGANPVAHASQFDEGRTTRFNLFDGSAVYTLDGTEIITVSVRKPDGHIVTESVTNTSSNYVEVVTTEQMTACAGDNLAQIKVEKGGDTIGFLNYILSVQKDPEDGGDPSASFIHDLETQVADMVATEVANQYDSANVIFDNDPTTGHGVGYAVTSEGVKNAIDAVGNPAASAVSYDNTGSGMTATNVQDAIDELDTNVGDLSTLTTSVTSSLVGAVNEVNRQLTDYVKVKYFALKASDVTRNMDLSSNVSLDSGYKFLCYMPSILPDGFTTDQYLWLSAPQSKQGYPWWNTNPIAGVGTGAKMRFFYLEIRDV